MGSLSVTGRGAATECLASLGVNPSSVPTEASRRWLIVDVSEFGEDEMPPTWQGDWRHGGKSHGSSSSRPATQNPHSPASSPRREKQRVPPLEVTIDAGISQANLEGNTYPLREAGVIGNGSDLGGHWMFARDPKPEWIWTGWGEGDMEDLLFALGVDHANITRAKSTGGAKTLRLLNYGRGEEVKDRLTRRRARNAASRSAT